MHAKYFLFSIGIVLLTTNCDSSETPQVKEAPGLKSISTEELIDANNAFAFTFFKEVLSGEKVEKNLMVSPVSLSLALSMAYNGAGGTTKNAFDEVLNYHGTLTEVNEINKQLMFQLSSKNALEFANSIWMDKGLPVKDEFIRLNSNYYKAEVQNLDFKNDATVDIINQWVSENTHEKIPSIIDETGDAVMFLINAMYFKANWQFTFDKDYTRKANFYDTDGIPAKVDMMTMTTSLSYMENEQFTSVVLPYEGNGYSMLVLLPKQGNGVGDIVQNLDASHWNNWMAEYQVKKVSVRLPKFKLAYKNMLNDELIKMGLGIAFTDQANFRGISDVPLLISKVLQKTYIDVFEEGTEAAAVTAIGFETTSIHNEPLPLFFTVDHPFVYAIRENTTGSICFIGKVGMPKYKDE